VADLLAQGVAWLEAQRKASLATSVTYVRGTDSVELAATVGRSEFEQVDESGLIRKIETRDYLFAAADLVLGGSQATPQEGDQVLEADGPQTRVYEVMTVGTEPAWRYSDPYRNTIRVHTKFVGVQ